MISWGPELLLSAQALNSLRMISVSISGTTKEEAEMQKQTSLLKGEIGTKQAATSVKSICFSVSLFLVLEIIWHPLKNKVISTFMVILKSQKFLLGPCNSKYKTPTLTGKRCCTEYFGLMDASLLSFKMLVLCLRWTIVHVGQHSDYLEEYARNMAAHQRQRLSKWSQ